MQAERDAGSSRRPSSPRARLLGGLGVLLACGAAVVDVAGRLVTLPGAWPVFSYAAAGAGAALVCVHLLIAILSRRASRRRVVAGLIGSGLLILAWALRGHPEIPPDLPLVAAECVAALLLLSQFPLVHRSTSASIR